MRRRAVAIFVAFLALAVVWTWPLAWRLSSRIPHDPGDPVLNIWLLWWNAHAIPFTERWWNPPIFFPMPGAMALSEHLAGIGLVATPVQWLGGNALAAYNVALILSFALSGFFTFLLVRRLLAASDAAAMRDVAALCGALAYGFGPYRAGQLAHLQVLTSQWMPLALLAMHAHLEDGGRRWLLLFAAAWLLQALSNGYYLMFFPILVVLWLAWFVDWRRTPQRGIELGTAWVATSLLLVPMLSKYASIQQSLGLARTSGEMVLFSAKPSSFLNASGMLAFWPSATAQTTEDFLFPGVTSVVLVLAGGVVIALRGRAVAEEVRPAGGAGPPFHRSALVFYAVTAAIMWAFAFGPAPPRSGAQGWVHPYALLAALPGFDALRVPARFAMLATLCFSIACGLALSRIAPRRKEARWLLAAAAIAGLIGDGWMRAMPLAAPPGRVILPDLPQALVLDLPANETPVDVAAMYRQTLHGRPIFNGYSGYTPPHYAIMSLAIRRGDPSVLTELARGRPLVISVNQAFDRGEAVKRLVEGLPGIESRGGSSGGALFVLPAFPAARVAPVGNPWATSIRDGTGAVIEIDLGQPRVVRTIGFALRWRYLELDRRMVIDASLDGVEWSSIWADWTGGPALAAALKDPLEVPVRLTVPDVTARYLRVSPASPWLRRAIRVYGPQ